ncbi:peptidase M50B-like-domain-containing protein [Cladochytrium replicatum]|nr:peptidase M50B-like-domain-containing protein [Cladochytrium replicatum]
MPHLFSFSSERLKPTAPQRRTLLIILGLFVAILILWHVLRQPFDLLYPFKLETVAFHELGHALMAIITGGKVILVEINPNEGGKTVFSGGVGWAVLPAGYLGSSLIGALLLACGFSFKASKIAAGVLCGLMVLAIFWASTWFTRLVTVGFLVGILSLFIVRKGQFALWLKYVVLFMGVMSCCYSVWDILDDLILRKVNESDASAMSRMTGGWVPSQVFGLIWFLVSLFFGAGGVITGLYLFKDEERYDGAPTSI